MEYLNCLYPYWDRWKRNLEKKRAESALEKMRVHYGGLNTKFEALSDNISNLSREALSFSKAGDKMRALQRLREKKGKESQLNIVVRNMDVVSRQMDTLENYWVGKSTVDTSRVFLEIQKRAIPQKTIDEVTKMTDSMDEGSDMWKQFESSMAQLSDASGMNPHEVSEEDLMKELEDMVTEDQTNKEEKEKENVLYSRGIPVKYITPEEKRDQVREGSYTVATPYRNRRSDIAIELGILNG
jgi:hypothetical protein